MRGISGFIGLMMAVLGHAGPGPESVGTSQLGQPQSTWVLVRDSLNGAAYLFDAADGEMQGLLSLTSFTPAVEVNHRQQEIYAAESYYSRGRRGERTDVVTIYDLPTLRPKGEVAVPQKIASLGFRQYIGLLDDARHLAVFNLTPAHSVTLVDVKQQTFVAEVSTPGCALIMPVARRGFLQICGDGTLQLLRFDARGKETERVRSNRFFDLQADPVADKPVPLKDGWLMTSYLGNVFEARASGENITITAPWSMLSEADRNDGWRPGGGQFLAYHAGLDLMFVLMNPGGEFSHDSAGTEVWVFHRGQQRRLHRLPIDYHGSDLVVSAGAQPLLTITGEDGQLHVLDVATMTQVRSIAEVGVFPGHLQTF